MYKYNPVRDSSSSITTILPVNNSNTNTTSLLKKSTENKNTYEHQGTVRNKDPTSDGNLIITINDKDKLKISFIDIRLNSLYKDMLIIEQPELLMNDFTNDNYMINISGNIIISCIKPLILLKPISLELKGTFKLDFIEINNDINSKKKDDDDGRDESVVVVKENRPFFLTKWDNVIDYPDGEVVDICKNQYESDLIKLKESYRKKKKNKNKKNKLKTQSMYNIFGMRFEENGNSSDEEDNASLPLTPVNTRDNVFNSKKPSLKTIYQSAPDLHQIIPTGGISQGFRPTIKTNNSFRFLDPGNMDNVQIDIGETPDDTTILDSEAHAENKENKIYMNPGNYEFPFRLKVNQRDMPETIEGLQAGSLTYMLTMKMYCENYGVVEHVKYLRVLKTLKANNINIHTGFKFKHDLKAKQKKVVRVEKDKQDKSKEIMEGLKVNADELSKAPITATSTNADTALSTSLTTDENTEVVDEFVTQLQMHIETPSKAYPLGGSIPLKFQIAPLIKNFKIDSIKISLNQKSILWDSNNEKYTIEKTIKDWYIDEFQGISGIEKVYLKDENAKAETKDKDSLAKKKKINKLKILSKNNDKEKKSNEGAKGYEKSFEYRLCDSDIEFLYLLPVPNNLKEITQNSLISENFYNGDKLNSHLLLNESLEDEQEFEKKYGYKDYKVLKLPRISNTHNLKVQIYVLKKNKKIPIEFSIPLMLFCSPNVQIQMRKVLLDKFKRIHFRKGEVELFFKDLPKGIDYTNDDSTTISEGGNTHEDTRNLMYSFIPRYFPQLQQVQPPPIYADSSKDEQVFTSMNKKEGVENSKVVEDINKNPPSYDNFRFDGSNYANRSDHQKIMKSERLTRDYYYGIYRDDGSNTANRNKSRKFKEGVLQYEEVSPQYKNV